MRLPGKGFPFSFNRFYNSKFSGQSGKPLGYGWTFNYNQQLVNTGSNVLVSAGDGSTWTFFNTNGVYTAEPGFYDTLTNSNGTWLLTDKRQTATRFDGNGALMSITDKNGNSTSCNYSGGVLSQIQDTAGRPIAFSTNAYGCIASITDPAGQAIRFQYDSNTNLSSVVDANGNTNSYAYNSNHQMTDATNALGIRYIHNEYDSTNFAVTRQCDAYTNWTYFCYDFGNRITIQTNVLRKIATHYFDTNLLETNFVDEANNSQEFLYDASHNRIYVKDKNGSETYYGYDSHGNVTNKIDALNNITAIEYDSLDNPVRRVDALTKVTTFAYDIKGNLISTTNALNFVNTIQYYSDGLPYIVTDSRGHGTTNYYDSQGNLTNIVDANGGSIRAEYDEVGRKLRQIDALNRTNSFHYDDNNNLLYSIDALGFTNLFTYDANNNQVSSRNPRGATFTNVFDLKDRTVATLASLNFTNGISYDALDRRIAAFDALGNPTYYSYDDIGNQTAVTNALTETTTFTYDPNGNLTSVADPTGHHVTNQYDALNRRIATVDIGISTNLTGYDPLNRIIATTNALGQITSFSYDGIGRVTNVVDAANHSTSFAYDENGNRIRTTDPDGNTWTNVFDHLNRLIEQHNPDGTATYFHYDAVGNITNKVTPNGDSIFYSFDALNRLTNITYPTGPSVTLSYDEGGNRTNIIDSVGVTTLQYDLLNRLMSVTDPYGQTVSNSFDRQGNRIGLVYPGNKAVNYGFDVQNRLVSLTNWQSGVVSYGYDSRGNLIATTNANATKIAYTYDVANRLISLTNLASDNSVITAYALMLDGLGNHLQETHEQPLFPILADQTNSYTYSRDNRLLTLGGQSVTHNPNGDLTGIGTNITFGYDSEDRLLQFNGTNGSSTCDYDGLGNRITRTVNGEARRFVLDRRDPLTRMLIETDTNGSPASYYIYGLGLVEAISVDGTITTYHQNIQGSTVALTDSSGHVTGSYAYDSFGSLANSDGDCSQPFRYLGRYGIMDDGTGLLNARARYFSPQLGRFITKDRVGGGAENAQGLNRYAYSLNNPLRFNDSSGLSPKEFTVSANSNDPFQELYRKLLEAGCPIAIADAVRRCQLEVPPGTSVDANIKAVEVLQKSLEIPHVPSFQQAIYDFTIGRPTELEMNRYLDFYYLVRNHSAWDYKQQGGQFEAFGNFNYGATGRALGIPGEVLRAGAGAAGMVSGTWEVANGLPFFSKLNGDNAVDQYWIQAGINYYDSKY
jgi:RHS repeat-associated protein